MGFLNKMKIDGCNLVDLFAFLKDDQTVASFFPKNVRSAL